MSRRRRAGSAFSLFSFQDIVTSVTAILILLVLILALELVTRRQAAAARDTAASRQALAATLAALEELVGRLVAAIPKDEIGPLAARTRAEVERDARIIREQAERAAADAEEARAVEGQARALAAKALARLEDHRQIRDEIDAMREEAAQADEEAKNRALENERDEELLAKRREQLVEQPTPGAELVFNAPADFDRQAWILEVAGPGFVVLKLGTPGPRELGANGDAVRRWVADLDAGRDHVLVLARPSGVDRLEDVRGALEGVGIPFGIDFIGEDQAVRDGAAEAAAAGEGA